MSILKTGAFCVAACASALAFGAPASAQTKVYVKVVVGQQQQVMAAQDLWLQMMVIIPMLHTQLITALLGLLALYQVQALGMVLRGTVVSMLAFDTILPQ